MISEEMKSGLQSEFCRLFCYVEGMGKMVFILAKIEKCMTRDRELVL